jgi:hypothetical protein
MKVKIIFIVLLLSPLIFIIGNSGSAQVNLVSIPLTIKEYSGITRINEPVTSGVPLKESDNIRDINNLRVEDGSGNPIPAQFKVLSRWKGTPADISKPIKWLLVDFQVNVDSSNSIVYYLKNTGSYNPNSNLALTQDSNQVIVSTGSAQFKINKNNFNLFDEVRLDLNSDQNYTIDEQIISPSLNNGPVVVDDDIGNTEYRSTSVAPIEVVIEENGPLKIVVKVSGYHQNSTGTNGYRYNTRLYFYKDKSYVKVRHSFINGDYSVEETTNKVKLDTELNLNSNKQISFYTEDSSYQNIIDGEAYIWQKMSIGPTEPLSYEVRNGNNIIRQGTKAINAWGTFMDDQWGLSVGTQYFWQKFPQKLFFNDSGLVSVELQAEPYTLQNSMGVSDEVVYFFHKSDEPNNNLRQILEGFSKAPLFATASNSWYIGSGVFYDLSVYPASSDYVAFDQAFEQVYNNTASFIEDNQLYGLRNYLDFPRYGTEVNGANHDDTVWGNNYWDAIYSLINQFARTSDYKYFDLAIPIARHFIETDIWNPDDLQNLSGFCPAAYQKHRSYNNAMHHYAEGIWYYYYLTGDRRVLDIGKTGADNLKRDVTYLGHSIAARTIHQRDIHLLNAYQSLGDQSYLDALEVNVDRTLNIIQDEGFYPFILYGDQIQYIDDGYKTDQAWITARTLIDFLYKYYQFSGDSRIKDVIINLGRNFDQYFRVSQDPNSSDFDRFYNQLYVTQFEDGSFAVAPYMRTGDLSTDYLSESARLSVASAIARAASLSNSSVLLDKVRATFDNINWLINDKFFGKVANGYFIRAAHLVHYIDGDTEPEFPRQFSFSLTRQARSTHQDTATLTLYTPGTSNLQYTISNKQTNSSGTASNIYHTERIPDGTYDIVVKIPYHLPKKLLNQTWPPTSTLNFGELKSGDTNNDNIINTQDLSILLSNWQTSHAISDLNGDGQVNSLDFSYINQNWNQNES